MKTEMVVRGHCYQTAKGKPNETTNLVHLAKKLPRKTTGVFLLHGENGEVGGLTPMDVEDLQELATFAPMDEYYAERYRDLAAKIEHILHPEPNDD